MRGASSFAGGGGWDRPEAACPPGRRPAAGPAGGFNAVQKLFTNRGQRAAGKVGKRITPRPSAEPIRVQRSDDNAAVIVVLGQKVAQDAGCQASGDTDPVGMLGMRPG